MLLSVVIPAYKQAKTIKKDINQIQRVLKNIRYDWEIIIVIDGKMDNTYQKLKKFRSQQIKIIQFKKNYGKGYAVKKGITEAEGDYILFLDSGMDIDPNGISMLLEHLEWYQADMILGSKRHPVSIVNYPTERKILSIGYYYLVRILFNIKVKDTQPGIKIFRKNVIKKIIPLLTIKKYAFDIEIISLAYHLGYTRIYEAPIKVNYQFESLTSAATFKTIWRMFYDTLLVFYRLKISRYYDKKLKLCP